jgi:hypothetical protein
MRQYASRSGTTPLSTNNAAPANPGAIFAIRFT